MDCLEYNIATDFSLPAISRTMRHAMRPPSWFCVAIVSLFLASSVVSQPPIADPDFLVQGEYSGKRNSMQVIALGDGEFSMVIYDASIEQRASSKNEPRRLDGDADTVADLADSLGVKKVQRESPTLGAKPPSGAIVLFDGSDRSLANWEGAKRSEEGLLMQGTFTKQAFRDYSLHLEFRTPWMPKARGQARGNSGVYHQGRYETQVLDSFGLAGRDNEAGGIYSVKAPDVNACLPPMRWQTYDVDFTAARWNGDRKIADARMTVRLNGVTVHSDVVVPHATTAAKLKESPENGPIYLQDHGNPVRYRNIWIVTRDAIREAARPIVPGYERFFANASDPQALGGELLISTLGCVACHRSETMFLPEKSGPNLNQVGSRLRPDALVAMIANPHQIKRGTTMPDPWMGLGADQRNRAAEAIASYLLLDHHQAPLVDRPSAASSVTRGKQLYHSVGCVACHEAFDGRDTPLSTTVPLGEVEKKYTVDSLANLIAQPHLIRSGGRMPSLVGSKGDAFAIASYLTRTVTERKNNATFRRRIYKGKWKKLPDFESLTAESEDRVSKLDDRKLLNEKHIGLVFESDLLVSAKGTYTFYLKSDDGSRLRVGDHEILNDGIHPGTTVEGTFELAAGLYSVRVEWFNYEGGGELAVSLNDPQMGRVRLEEVISDGNASTAPLLESRFEPRGELVQRGRELFGSAGCASCHEFGEPRPEQIDVPDLASLNPEKGCLANAVSRPAVDFHLSPRQRESIIRALRLRNRVEVKRELADQEFVHLTLAGMNCYACHQRAGIGGPEASRDGSFQTTTAEMGWESRLPPPLDGVGDKLKPDYLKSVLADGANERPYMLTRMPGFGAKTLQRLHEKIIQLDRRESPGRSIAMDEQTLSAGRKLVGASGLSCVKCHSYNKMKGGGLGVLDLLSMPSRLNEDWFQRYLQDPTGYRPGTRMPNSFPNGRSSFTKLFDGDPHRQTDAMWAYLKAGTSAKEPSGVRAGSIMLIAKDRPRIYRNFFDGVSPRGIAVGFPADVNLIWDAERMGLNTIWKNEFINASRHWTGRGQGPTSPAGDSVNRLETWTPLISENDIAVTWPQQSGRQLGYRFGGYRLDQQGHPTFNYFIGGTMIAETIRPSNSGGLVRSIHIESKSLPSSMIWRIARAKDIQPDQQGYLVDAIRLFITGAQCQIVSVDGQSELRARIEPANKVSITQRIEW